MSDSYPTIQESLSDLQKEFLGCVESHLDPPEFGGSAYRVEALLAHGEGEADLPGNAIRFTLAIDESDREFSERCHSIEFLGMEGGGEPRRLGRIRHSMKRTEGSQGRFFWTESHFEVSAPGVPDGHAPEEDVEREVRTYVERLKSLERAIA